MTVYLPARLDKEKLEPSFTLLSDSFCKVQMIEYSMIFSIVPLPRAV